MASNEKLAPCPRCHRGQGQDCDYGQMYWVACYQCNFKTAEYGSRHEADSEWNTRAAQPVAVAVRKLGRVGASYDSPQDKRAYTYSHQPDNLGASKLARAWAQVKPGGDGIDTGLSLLKALEGAGFGVFELEGM